MPSVQVQGNVGSLQSQHPWQFHAPQSLPVDSQMPPPVDDGWHAMLLPTHCWQTWPLPPQAYGSMPPTHWFEYGSQQPKGQVDGSHVTDDTHCKLLGSHWSPYIVQSWHWPPPKPQDVDDPPQSQLPQDVQHPPQFAGLQEGWPTQTLDEKSQDIPIDWQSEHWEPEAPQAQGSVPFIHVSPVQQP